MMMLAMPVSSSSVRKTNPFAVPGRWRVMTMPATRTRRPLRLPQRRPPVVAECVQRAIIGERYQLVAPQPRARDEIVDRMKASRARGLRGPVVRAVVAEPAFSDRLGASEV